LAEVSDIIAPKAQSSVRSSNDWPNEVSCHQGREAHGTLPLERQGSEFGNPLTGKTKLSWFQPATKPVPLSSPARDNAWRQFTAKRYSGNEFALVASAMQYSSSARTATADSATAAPHVVRMPECANDGAPTTATNRAPKDGSIIATGSATTGVAAGKPMRA
jgi:hypothetical protein